jgi:hypothetical protein
MLSLSLLTKRLGPIDDSGITEVLRFDDRQWGITSLPPGNSLLSSGLPLSSDRAGATRSRIAGVSSISGSMRWTEKRLASSVVGCTASIGPGAWWMLHPEQQVTLADDGRDYDAVAAARGEVACAA